MFSQYKNVLFHGIIAGLGSLLILFVMSQFGKAWLFSKTVYFLTMFLYIICMVRAINVVDNDMENTDLKTYIREGFGTFVVANLIFWTVYFTWFNSDPTLLDAMKGFMKSNLEKTLTDAKTPQAIQQIQESINQLQAQDVHLSLKDVLYKMVQGMVGGFLLSVILAFVTVKRNEG